MNIYWGDLHNHCGITYGFGSLENAIQRARGRLDFCAFTGHAMWPDIYSKTPETEFLVNFHEVGFKKLRERVILKCMVTMILLLSFTFCL